MVVEFEETIENTIEFVLFHRTHSPSIRRQILIVQIASTIIAFPIPLILMYFLPHGISKLIDAQNVQQSPGFPYLIAFACVLGLFLSIYMFIQFPKANKEQTIKGLRKLLTEGENINSFGPCALTLSPEGIFCKRKLSEYKTGWSAISKVAQNDLYIFLYIDSVNAFVIPKDAFTTDEAQKEFLDYVNANTRIKN